MQDSLYALRTEYWNEMYRRWVSEEFASFPWFFNIAFLIASYIVWIKLVDKRRLKDILLFGSFIAVAAGYIDLVGVTTGLWEYDVHLLPFSPSLFPFDYTVVPIVYMLLFQYTSSWRNYLIGSVLASFIIAFVINPVYVYLRILRYHRFNYFLMFALIFIVTTIIKSIYNWIASIDAKKPL